MNSQNKFFKNAWKNIFKSKVQLFTVIFLVFITSMIFSLSLSSTTRVEKSFRDFVSVKKSNLHDFVIDLSDSVYINDFEKDIFGKKIANSDMRNDMVLTYLQDRLTNTDLDFDLNRIESRTSIFGNKALKIFGLNPDQEVDKLVVSKGMNLSLWKEYTQAININTKKWVYINEQFAQSNNIKINDIIRLQPDNYGSTILVNESENLQVDLSLYEGIDINSWINRTSYINQSWFQVVGYGSSADMTTPIIDETRPLPNTKDEGLIYLDSTNLGYETRYYKSVFGDNQFDLHNSEKTKIWYSDGKIKNQEVISSSSNREKEVVYVGKFKSQQNVLKDSVFKINKYLTEMKQAETISLHATFQNSKNSSLPIATIQGSGDYKFYNRIWLLKMTILFYKSFCYIVMIITLTIGVVMLVVMLNKQLKIAFGQTGLLISLGFKKSSLIWSNSLYPLIISTTGGLLGYLLGVSGQELVIKIINKYFAIQMQGFNLSLTSLLVVVLGIFIFLEIVTLITCFYAYYKYTPLEMINYEGRNSTNNFKLMVKKVLTRNKKFHQKFRGAILSGSIPKLTSVFSVMFVASSLITFGTVLPNVLNDNKQKTFQNLSYDNLIEYQSPIYNSPTSFYKTYNPYAKRIDITPENILKMYTSYQVNSQIYNPSLDLGTLNNMTHKAVDLTYLTNPNLTIETHGNVDPNPFKKPVIFNLWPDLKNYNWDIYWSKNSIINILQSENKLKDNLESLEKIRQFYWKYHQTVGLDKFRENYLTITGNRIRIDPQKQNDLISNEDVHNIVFLRTYLNKNGQLEQASQYQNSLYDYLDKDNFQANVLSAVIPIYNWFVTFFHNNLQQAFLQGIYNSSPLIIKEIIQDQINTNKDFTIGFGLNAYNEKEDDIGVYINGYVEDQVLKIYGLEQNNKTQKLLNDKAEPLLHLLGKNENNILINQSLAKKLGTKVGDKLNVNQVINALAKNNQPLDIDTWDVSELSASDNEGYTSASNFYNSSMLQTIKKGWINKTINDKEEHFVYNSKIDLNSESLIGPTNMVEQIGKGEISIINQTYLKEYSVAGIVDQYGDNKAWINNKTAKHQAKYDQTEKLFFSLFKKEWSKPKTNNVDVLTLANFLNKLDPNLSSVEQFDKFKTFTSEAGCEHYWTLFEQEYPVYNYKTSLDASLIDISKTVSSVQRYGDYSMFGLNGGISNQTSYPAYVLPSLESIMKVDEATKIVDRINKTANAIIYFVIVIFIFLSAIIIFLTINLIIAENTKIIAVMKILGYPQIYLARIFIGIYIPVTIFSAVIGFVCGWFALNLIIIQLYPSIVLPMIFQLWYIAPGIFGAWLLYVLSVSLSWSNLKRISVLIAVQGE